MMHKIIALIHSVFEFSKSIEMMFYKIIEEIDSLFSICWISKFFRKIIIFFCFNKSCIIFFIKRKVPRFLMIFIKFSIFTIKIPFISLRCISIHENIFFFSHKSIKIFHNRRFFIFFQKIIMRKKKVYMIIPNNRNSEIFF